MALPDLAHTDSAPPTLLPRRSRVSRIPKGLWLAAIVGLLGVGATLAVMGGTKGQPVLTARHTIVSGMEVGPGDFTVVDVHAPADVTAQLVAGTELSGVKGQIATHNLVQGDLVQRSSLTTAAAAGAQRAMSIPVDTGRAVDGSLRAGDLVDVVDSATGVPTYVATGARVLAAGGAKSSGLGAATSRYSVTIAVDERQALAVALAITAGKLDIIRSTGAPAATVAPPAPPTTLTTPTTRTR